MRLDGARGSWYDDGMMNQHPTRTAHPASFWGTEAAKVDAHERMARAMDPRLDDDSDYAAALARALQAPA